MRDLGSVIGISITGALLETNMHVNHAIMLGDVNPFNRALQSGAVARLWNPDSVHGLVMLNEELTRQAKIIAYMDDFKLMLILAIVVVPLLIFTRGSSAR